jgi:5-methylcytosine-specific restriction endonuclease McrA
LECCAAKDRVRGKIRYARDPVAWCEKTKRWEAANRERLLAIKRQWKKKNPESVRASARKSYAKDPAKGAAKYRKRRARKIANGGIFTSADIAEIRLMQRDRCAICAQKLKSKGTIDHIEPLARGGTNDRRNLQLLCSACNARKCARDPVDHMRSVGFLL